LFVFFLIFLSSYAQADPKIVGGSAAAEGQFPWMVRLIINSGRGTATSANLCAGFIYDEYHVITAGQCLALTSGILTNQFAGYPLAINVQYGSVNTATMNTRSAISYIIHPRYKNTLQLTNGSIDYDVAIIRMAVPFTFGATVNKISLIDDTDDLPDKHDTVYTAGWGQTILNGNTSSTLQVLGLPYVDFDDCKDDHKDIDEDLQVCAGGVAGQSSCYGDGGAPLFTTNNSSAKAIGITSVIDINCSGPPGVYANIPGFAADWIKDTVASHEACTDACKSHFLACRLTGVQNYHNRKKFNCKDIRRICIRGCPN